MSHLQDRRAGAPSVAETVRGAKRFSGNLDSPLEGRASVAPVTSPFRALVCHSRSQGEQSAARVTPIELSDLGDVSDWLLGR